MNLECMVFFLDSHNVTKLQDRNENEYSILDGWNNGINRSVRRFSPIPYASSLKSRFAVL